MKYQLTEFQRLVNQLRMLRWDLEEEFIFEQVALIAEPARKSPLPVLEECIRLGIECAPMPWERSTPKPTQNQTMVTIGTCRHCKYWDQEDQDEALRICNQPKALNGYNHTAEDVSSDGLILETDEGWVIMSVENHYGDFHYTPKDKTEAPED